MLSFVELGRVLTLSKNSSFRDRLRNANEQVKVRLEEARRRIRAGFRLELNYVTTGNVSRSLADEAEGAARDFGATLNVISRQDVVQMLQDYVDGAAPPVHSLDLPIETENIFHHRHDGSEIESWIFLVKAPEMGRAFDRVGRRLFARNIRGFLGSTEINQEMKKTLGQGAASLLVLQQRHHDRLRLGQEGRGPWVPLPPDEEPADHQRPANYAGAR